MQEIRKILLPQIFPYNSLLFFNITGKARHDGFIKNFYVNSKHRMERCAIGIQTIIFFNMTFLFDILHVDILQFFLCNSHR